MDKDDKNAWNLYGKQKKIPGYNAFMSVNVKNLNQGRPIIFTAPEPPINSHSHEINSEKLSFSDPGSKKSYSYNIVVTVGANGFIYKYKFT